MEYVPRKEGLIAKSSVILKIDDPPQNAFDSRILCIYDEDTCLTYRGYIKFLETDLQTVYPIGEGRSKNKYKKGMADIAKQMLYRGDVSHYPRWRTQCRLCSRKPC